MHAALYYTVDKQAHSLFFNLVILLIENKLIVYFYISMAVLFTLWIKSYFPVISYSFFVS